LFLVASAGARGEEPEYAEVGPPRPTYSIGILPTGSLRVGAPAPAELDLRLNIGRFGTTSDIQGLDDAFRGGIVEAGASLAARRIAVGFGGWSTGELNASGGRVMFVQYTPWSEKHRSWLLPRACRGVEATLRYLVAEVSLGILSCAPALRPTIGIGVGV
jgi:hypothetical protein